MKHYSLFKGIWNINVCNMRTVIVNLSSFFENSNLSLIPQMESKWKKTYESQDGEISFASH